MSDLTPPMLYELGLQSAFEDLAGKIERQHGVRIRLEDDEQPKPMDQALRGFVFQAARECIVNALKHAGPCAITVSTTREGANVRVRVADTGAGFDPTQRNAATGRERGGFGLFNLQERAEGLGGRCEIASRPGQGTIVTITVPLHPAQPDGDLPVE